MQQITFIDLFTSFGQQTRPSSGALLTIYTAFGTMHRYCCWPVTRLRCNSKLHLNLVTGRQQYRCIVPKAVYTIKSAPEDGRVCCPKLVKRSINVICCILLVAYIVVLMVHGLTNVKFSQDSRPMWLDLNIGPTIAKQGCNLLSRTLWWVPCCQEHMTYIGPQALYRTYFRLLMLRLLPIKKSQSFETGSPANSLEHSTGIPKVHNRLEVGGALLQKFMDIFHLHKRHSFRHK